MLENLSQWAESWPASKTEEVSGIVELAISQGWYLNEVFLL